MCYILFGVCLYTGREYEDAGRSIYIDSKIDILMIYSNSALDGLY